MPYLFRLAGVLAGLAAVACDGPPPLVTLEAMNGAQAQPVSSAGPDVLLESLGLAPQGSGGAMQLYGDILVKDLSASGTSRLVQVVYTTDGWRSARVLGATHRSAVGGGYERWDFSAGVPTQASLE